MEEVKETWMPRLACGVTEVVVLVPGVVTEVTDVLPPGGVEEEKETLVPGGVTVVKLYSVGSLHLTNLKTNSPTVVLVVDRDVQVELVISEQPFSSTLPVPEEINERIRTLDNPLPKPQPIQLFICKELNSVQRPLNSWKPSVRKTSRVENATQKQYENYGGQSPGLSSPNPQSH